MHDMAEVSSQQWCVVSSQCEARQGNEEHDGLTAHIVLRCQEEGRKRQSSDNSVSLAPDSASNFPCLSHLSPGLLQCVLCGTALEDLPEDTTVIRCCCKIVDGA